MVVPRPGSFFFFFFFFLGSMFWGVNLAGRGIGFWGLCRSRGTTRTIESKYSHQACYTTCILL
jgi:hypothetical protein